MNGKPHLKWKTIMTDCVKLITGSLTNGEPIESIGDLHSRLEALYQKKGKVCPKMNTFRQRFRDELRSEIGLSEKQRVTKEHLYQFAGAYDKVSTSELFNNVSVAFSTPNNNCNWLFIKLERIKTDESSYQRITKRQKHLYHLSLYLKKQFADKIWFVSFDRETLVILCTDSQACLLIRNYIDGLQSSK